MKKLKKFNQEFPQTEQEKFDKAFSKKKKRKRTQPYGGKFSKNLDKYGIDKYHDYEEE